MPQHTGMRMTLPLPCFYSLLPYICWHGDQAHTHTRVSDRCDTDAHTHTHTCTNTQVKVKIRWRALEAEKERKRVREKESEREREKERAEEQGWKEYLAVTHKPFAHSASTCKEKEKKSAKETNVHQPTSQPASVFDSSGYAFLTPLFYYLFMSSQTRELYLSLSTFTHTNHDDSLRQGEKERERT